MNRLAKAIHQKFHPERGDDDFEASKHYYNDCVDAVLDELDKIYAEAKYYNKEEIFMKQMRELAKVDISI